MATVKSLPKRSEVKISDTWDLSSLYADDAAWEVAFKQFEERIPGYAQFQGKLGTDAATLAACLKFDDDLDRLADNVGTYASLRVSEDTAGGEAQRMMGRFRNAASKAGQAGSYIRPEIMSIPDETMQKFLASAELAPFKLVLERVLRSKPHTLTSGEENLLAMQAEMAGATSQVFSQLNNADLKFGFVTNEKGEQVELSHASFSAFLHSPNREVREKAFRQYYSQFKAHENTLAAVLGGSMQRDCYYAKARKYGSALEYSQFPDNVPRSVYDNLCASVRKNLPNVHRYYDLRRRKMNLDHIHHYDTYVPILSEREVTHTWDQAVDVVMDSLKPLGTEYCSALKQGLSGRWCDRYENQGKRSGAFSSGTYDSIPYILMNYQPTVLDHVFTLTHEAGHSMHSYYSARNQPHVYYGYTIFVAEVASTFNEQLLSKHLMSQARDDQQRAYLINREIDAIRGTIIRQTMFAEFERDAHAEIEKGEPLTLDRFKQIYRSLLDAYFGPEFAIDAELELECFRIPHFYGAFYVYKYATGLSAAIALAERVTNGGPKELNDYLNFLKGGCSKDPLDLLRDAGVDMEKPAAVDTALARFGKLVDELDSLL
jgi:oligoendopeptidase F